MKSVGREKDSVHAFGKELIIEQSLCGDRDKEEIQKIDMMP